MRSGSSCRRKAGPGPSRSTKPWIPARAGGRPRGVAPGGGRGLGAVGLRDSVKGGIRERFAELRQMGIKPVMAPGDTRLTAAAIAAEAGVDEFLAEATPEAKLALIRR